MRHDRTRRAVLLAAAAALSLSACGSGSTPGMEHGDNQPSTAAGAGFNDADVQFAQAMIPHHAQAVDMAELAATRAVDPELRSMALAIKSAQQPEIDTMTGWLNEWGRPTAKPGGGHNMPGMEDTMPGMMSPHQMSTLKATSGTSFDRLFAQMMIAHHNGAILMARDEVKNGENAGAKQLAAAMEKTQSAEVSQLQKILDRL